MKTLLVPTDFSKTSKAAVSYAIGLAKKVDARVIILSVINVNESEETLPSMRKLQQDLIDTANRDAVQLMGEIAAEKGKVDVSYRQAFGYPVVDTIEQVVRANKVELIVMGSKGATGLRKYLIGSNAASVIDNSSVPVLVVPAKSKFMPLKKFVYATDGKHFLQEVKTVSKLAALVNATLDVVHVIKTGDAGKDTLKNSKEKLTSALKDPSIKVHVVSAKTVVAGVNDFVHNHKADLLTMFTHQLDFKEKVLGRSVTRALALGLNVPLLTFNRNK